MKCSRVLYFCVTCFFVVLYLHHVSHYFFRTGVLVLLCDPSSYIVVHSPSFVLRLHNSRACFLFLLCVSDLFFCFNCCNRSRSNIIALVNVQVLQPQINRLSIIVLACSHYSAATFEHYSLRDFRCISIFTRSAIQSALSMQIVLQQRYYHPLELSLCSRELQRRFEGDERQNQASLSSGELWRK